MAVRDASAETACLQKRQMTSSPGSGAPQLAHVGGAPPGPFHWLMHSRMTQAMAAGNRRNGLRTAARAAGSSLLLALYDVERRVQ